MEKLEQEVLQALLKDPKELTNVRLGLTLLFGEHKVKEHRLYKQSLKLLDMRIAMRKEIETALNMIGAILLEIKEVNKP